LPQGIKGSLRPIMKTHRHCHSGNIHGGDRSW
jgi:hypothetical protein